jgi:hypothetical protein
MLDPRHAEPRGEAVTLRRPASICLSLVLVVLGANAAHAHEPVFGVGPETIYEGGVGVEVGWDFEDEGDERTAVLDTELIYGVTPNFSLTVASLQVLRRHTDDGTRSGLGDMLVRGKLQVWKRDRLNASEKLTLIAGLTLPTGSEHGSVPLGSGSFDPVFGIAAGHESRTWYAFGSIRYLLRTRHDGLNRGDRIFYEVAAGLRPWRTGYLEPDLVILLEFNGLATAQDRDRAGAISSTGRNVGWLGPTALLSYRNLMTKAGIQFPVYANRRGSQERPDLRAVLALEVHF